jgi:excisionase family DNA binding protein
MFVENDAQEVVRVDELLTVTEVAQVLRVSADTVRRWAEKGLLPPPLRVGPKRERLFVRSELDKARRQALEGGETAGQDTPATHPGRRG